MAADGGLPSVGRKDHLGAAAVAPELDFVLTLDERHHNSYRLKAPPGGEG
jgi:hypothetical protein